MYKFVTSLTRLHKQIILLLVDLTLIPLSLMVALTLSSDGPGSLSEIATLTLIMIAVGAIFSIMLELPRIKLNAYELQAVQRTCAFAAMVGATGGLVAPLLFAGTVPTATMIVFTMVLMIASVMMRLVLRKVLIAIYQRGQIRLRVLIYGAGQTGVQLATAIKNDDTVEPVAFVDDNPTLQRMMIAGLPVYAPVRIEELIRTNQIDRVVLAMPSLSRPKQARLIRKIRNLGCEVRTLPSFAAMVASGDMEDGTLPVVPNDFLNRSGLECDLQGLCGIYAGRSVMITGAGGSIGSELCRQVIACRPRCIVLYETNELALYQIERELIELHHATIIPVLGSVTDDVTVRRTMADHGVEIVLHAAAYKHVPMVERNQLSGLANNVLGTKVVADAARDAGVTHFTLISTDKAVRPTNVMGASKRLAELIVQDLATRSRQPGQTRFSMVRFGNVLGSSGSVIPLFEDQIARGGPVTLTHTEVTRYFMTVSEAARLVLLAGSFTEGGDVFVLDMGTPVPIQRLARQMIEGAGYTVRDVTNPDGDIEIVITGLRPGEKLHEELLIGSNMLTTRHAKILRAQEVYLSEIEVAAAVRALRSAIETGDEMAARAVVERWVDGYAPAKVAEAKV